MLTPEMLGPRRFESWRLTAVALLFCGATPGVGLRWSGLSPRRRAPVGPTRLGAMQWAAPGLDEAMFEVERVQRLPGFAGAEVARPAAGATRDPELCNPVLVVPNFLSAAECDAFIAAGQLRQRQGIVSEMYLNHRVNQELEQGGSSAEAADLIQDQGLDEAQLGANCPSGMRTPLPHTLLLEAGLAQRGAEVQELVRRYDDASEAEREVIFRTVQGSIAERVLDLLGLPRDEVQFTDKLWLSPTENRIMFRDQTIVHYKGGEGVAPHVDGKDATILMYLNDVPEGCGGRTVFPEAGIAVAPKRGTAVFYCSRGNKLLHYAERVVDGHEKWVSQMLIDYRFRPSPTTNVRA